MRPNRGNLLMGRLFFFRFRVVSAASRTQTRECVAVINSSIVGRRILARDDGIAPGDIVCNNKNRYSYDVNARVHRCV